jgi:hypothetical protein
MSAHIAVYCQAINSVVLGRTRNPTMRKFYGLLTGTMIGALLGYMADQILTSYVLQHSEEAVTFIITNALSAFIMFPLFIILSAYIGYRMAKKPGKSSKPLTPT